MHDQSSHPSLAEPGAPAYARSAPGEFWCPIPAEPRAGLVFPRRVGSPGGPTPWQARGAEWRRTSHGFYLPAVVDITRPEQRIATCSVVMPYGSGVTGWAGLRWQGGVWFDGLAPDGVTELPVTILTADNNVRDQAGFVISEERRDLTELVVVDGLAVSDPLRSITFEMRYAASVREAVVAFGMAAYSDLVSAAEVVQHSQLHPGWTGAPQLRAACGLLEENAWSPWEDRTRMVWLLDAGLPAPLANRPIFDRHGNLLGTPDLLDEEAGLVIEYDGEVHLGHERRRLDKEREARFRRYGLEYLTVRRGDTAARDLLAHRMRTTRSRARFAAPSRRQWSVETPPWWVPTFTVEQRRALTPQQRVDLLRLRLKVS